MKNRTTEDRIKDRMEKCIHFNGVMSNECKIGVKYDDVMQDGSGIPCIKLNNKSTKLRLVQCEKLVLHTRDEAEKIVQRQDEHYIELITDLAEGRCPTCKQEVKQQQVGSCVYGTCGHRLYQGRVNPEYAA